MGFFTKTCKTKGCEVIVKRFSGSGYCPVCELSNVFNSFQNALSSTTDNTQHKYQPGTWQRG